MNKQTDYNKKFNWYYVRFNITNSFFRCGNNETCILSSNIFLIISLFKLHQVNINYHLGSANSVIKFKFIALTTGSTKILWPRYHILHHQQQTSTSDFLVLSYMRLPRNCPTQQCFCAYTHFTVLKYFRATLNWFWSYYYLLNRQLSVYTQWKYVIMVKLTFFLTLSFIYL